MWSNLSALLQLLAAYLLLSGLFTAAASLLQRSLLMAVVGVGCAALAALLLNVASNLGGRDQTTSLFYLSVPYRYRTAAGAGVEWRVAITDAVASHAPAGVMLASGAAAGLILMVIARLAGLVGPEHLPVNLAVGALLGFVAAGLRRATVRGDRFLVTETLRVGFHTLASPLLFPAGGAVSLWLSLAQEQQGDILGGFFLLLFFGVALGPVADYLWELVHNLVLLAIYRPASPATASRALALMLTRLYGPGIQLEEVHFDPRSGDVVLSGQFAKPRDVESFVRSLQGVKRVQFRRPAQAS